MELQRGVHVGAHRSSNAHNRRRRIVAIAGALTVALSGLALAPSEAGAATVTAVPAVATAQLSAAFSASPRGLHGDFDASGSTGAIISYQWDFGDGTSGTGVKIGHDYKTTGAYLVSLVVSDGTLTASVGASFTFTAPPVIPNVAPVAKFVANSTSGTAPLTVNFDASGSSDSDGRIVSYAWTFGDGSSATGTQPSHTFAAGQWTVVLTVTDDAGATGSATATEMASTPPPPPISPPPPTPSPTGGANCVRGEDYWLDHSNTRSATYNMVWNTVGGPSAPFFLSGATWRAALAAPSFANAYWTLAGDFIVARLNTAAGAQPPSDVRSAMTLAAQLLGATKPSRGERDRNLVALARVLERFDSGQSGPKRCGDDRHPPHFRLAGVWWWW